MGELVEFKANGGTDSGYLAIPEEGSGPGLIVIQEWWGLVDHIKDVCERFAGEGFVALAPDLYHGKSTKSPDEAGKLMMALRIDEAEKEISGAIQYLQDQEATTNDKVGVVGFCMGGALSLYAACDNPDNVAACADFYGVHPAAKPNLAALQAPLLGIFAEKDDFTPPAAVHELDRQLTAAGKPHDFTIYPNTDHAFFNNDRPEVYAPDAARDAWGKLLAFFGKNL